MFNVLNCKKLFKTIHTKLYVFFSVIFLISFASSTNASPECHIEKFKTYQMQYCFYKGKGPLLVFEASLGNDMSIWPKSFLKKFNTFASVLVYNRIGYEGSHFYQSKISQAITAESVANQLHALLRKLSINKQIVLVGHSIGGLYMQYFARNYPETIKGIVLIDASSAFEPKINSPFITKGIIEKNSIPYFEMLGYNKSMDQIEASPKFPNIPLLVITATDHELNKEAEDLWQEVQKKIVKQSSKGEHLVAYGKGHFVYQEAPDLVIKRIQEFIQSNHID